MVVDKCRVLFSCRLCQQGVLRVLERGIEGVEGEKVDAFDGATPQLGEHLPSQREASGQGRCGVRGGREATRRTGEGKGDPN